MRTIATKDSADTPRDARAITLPPGTPAWITPKLLQRTMETWQPFYKEPLTLDDAVIILISVGRLFEVLHGTISHEKICRSRSRLQS